MATNFTINSGGRSAAVRRAEARARGAQRRLNISPRHMQFDETLALVPEKLNMSDDISLYGGNSPQGSPRPCSISPCMDASGMLSAENSPQRFIPIQSNSGSIQQRQSSFGDIDYNSVDSGYGQQSSSSSLILGSSIESASNVSRTCFKFAEPLGLPPKRTDTTPPKNSSLISPPKSSSCFRQFNSLSSDSIDSMDDELLELLDMESMEEDVDEHLPAHFKSIISGDILKSTTIIPDRPAFRRCLSLTETPTNILRSNNTRYMAASPKSPEQLKPLSESNTTPYSSRADGRAFKRPEAPLISPNQSKRFKLTDSTMENKENNNMMVSPKYHQKQQPTTPTTTLFSNQCRTDENTAFVHRPVLRKSISMNDANIMSALARCKLK